MAEQDREVGDKLAGEAMRIANSIRDRIIPVTGRNDVGPAWVTAMALLAIHAELRHGNDSAAERDQEGRRHLANAVDHYTGAQSTILGQLVEELHELKKVLTTLTYRLE